ncbi:hypothetical protein DPMN_158598 [Dreissena polymorpha]|uniref:Uncharacterized protein n=1 Tax=Dreissena polymorpha TaxID=45954 RepID=A0A9D4ELN7_DREPO|nr:hypothetical protein DPMN_158598 [Dreissena polymorpha]
MMLMIILHDDEDLYAQRRHSFDKNPRLLLLLNELKFQSENLKIVVANPIEHAREDVVEYKEVTGPVVEPCFTHVPLNSLVVNEHLLNKLLAFSIEQRAEEFTRKLQLLELKSFPCDLTVAGLMH